MTRLSLLLVLPATFAGAADRPNLPAELTVSQALNIALSNSITLREAEARLEQASGRYVQSRGTLLPQMSLSARQNIQTVNLIGIGIPIQSLTGKIGPFGSMDARLFLTQDLFNLASIRSWQSSRSGQESSRLLVENARELVALDVVATFLEALKAKASRDTLTAQARLANDLYRLTRDRVVQGVSAELDANRAMQQVNTLDQERQEAEHSYVVSKLKLANILQARVTSDFEIAADETAYGTGAAPDREATLKTALAARADHRAAEANVRAADLHVRSLKATRVPTLHMSFSDGQSGNTPVHNVNTYRLQGAIDVPIFTGGQIRGQIEEAEGALREAQASLEANRSQIEADVLAAVSGVEWALREVETSIGNVKLSRDEVEFTRARFTQGISDNTEVVNAQDRLARADDAQIRAKFMLGLARANLARATGVAEKTYRQ